MKRAHFILILMLIALQEGASGYSVLQRETNHYGYELDLNLYYTAFEFYVPFEKKKREYIAEDTEVNMYKVLFKKSIVPKFFLTEASVYPLPCAGVYIKENYNTFYNKAGISDSYNWIKSLCAGFEEPWAFSFLLGNLVNFKPEEAREGYRGKAYLGYLVSFGAYHIKDNILVEDKWTELEWKIKGDRILPDRKISWSFRIGGKYHGNEYIKDILYLSIRRERVDHDFHWLSLIKNSSLEYTMDIDTKFQNLVRHYLLFSKNFPYKNSKVVFQLQLGFIKEWREKYTGPLKRENSENNFFYVIRPNLKF
jgi:hypothetical protein